MSIVNLCMVCVGTSQRPVDWVCLELDRVLRSTRGSLVGKDGGLSTLSNALLHGVSTAAGLTRGSSGFVSLVGVEL